MDQTGIVIVEHLNLTAIENTRRGKITRFITDGITFLAIFYVFEHSPFWQTVFAFVLIKFLFCFSFLLLSFRLCGTGSLPGYKFCSITRAVTNERIINPALERTYLDAN